MKSSSLHGKTVRPGLMAYSFYRSDRHPASRRTVSQSRAKRHHKSLFMAVLVIAVVALGCFVAARVFHSFQQNSSGSESGAAAVAVADGPKQCAGNKLDKMIVVSVGQQHLWACHNQAVMYNSPVVTGREKLVDNKTPRGTYKIYEKQTDTTLTGVDSTGKWSDPVKYWMPFLQNQYGIYGFHDAGWRPNSDFGNVDPNTDKASHGCVNLPLPTAQWLYNWAPVGTTVVVKD